MITTTVLAFTTFLLWVVLIALEAIEPKQAAVIATMLFLTAFPLSLIF
jgi:hypothetical protein